MTTRRQFMMSVPAAAAAFALADHLVLDVAPARAQQIDPLQGHFHPKGKAPSKFTLELLKKANASNPPTTFLYSLLLSLQNCTKLISKIVFFFEGPFFSRFDFSLSKNKNPTQIIAGIKEMRKIFLYSPGL